MALQTESKTKETGLQAENQKYRSMSDSLKFVVVSKDSLIDSLTVRLNEMAMKREKEKAKSTGSIVKKSTLTKDQECEKKSLFLYNFTKYIEWPIEYNGTDFVIGVCGSDQMIKSLQDFMLQKKVSGKRITVEKYKKGAKYNVVYVTSAEMGNFSTIKNAVKKNKTLLVTDEASSGSHISFLLDQDKVRYIVDKIAIEKTGLKVGQELMRYSG
ncbi:MAG: hypothetical protein JWP12_2736 [Bacteroidetes bacterium]|nr:hypothetical protein [Bacteroidota bacterium]